MQVDSVPCGRPQCDKTSQMKTAFPLLSIFLAFAVAPEVLAYNESTYVRGMMIAVDSRDHQSCQSQKDYLKQRKVHLKEDLCLQDNDNPLRVVVLTIPSSELDFQSEIELLRHPVNPPATHNRGALLLLPKARNGENALRISMDARRISAAQIRLSNLPILSEIGPASIRFSFVQKRLPLRYTEEQKAYIERLLRRVSVRSQEEKTIEEEDSSALSSLNIMNGINSALKDATDNDSAEMGFFIPDSPAQESDGLIPRRFGFKVKITF